MDKRKKYSRKREAILEVIRGTRTHPSAEWIYTQLKPQFPDLSLGTVYRNLALFRKEGEIISIGTVNGQERYDGDTRPHAHFICTCCGAVIDVDMLEGGKELDESLAEKTGFRVLGHELIFHGSCSQCTASRQVG